MYNCVLSSVREVGVHYTILVVDGEMPNLRIKFKGIKKSLAFIIIVP